MFFNYQGLKIIENILASHEINFQLPFIDVSIGDAIDYVTNALNKLKEVLEQPGATIDALNRILDSALGPAIAACGQPCAGTGALFSLDTNANSSIIVLDINLIGQASLFQTLSFSLKDLLNKAGFSKDGIDLLASFVSVSAEADFSFRVKGHLQIKLGITIPTKIGELPTFLMYPETGFQALLAAQASNINFNASLGPLQVKVEKGCFALGDAVSGSLGPQLCNNNPRDAFVSIKPDLKGQVMLLKDAIKSKLVATWGAGSFLYLPVTSPATGQIAIVVPSIANLLQNIKNVIRVDFNLDNLLNFVRNFKNPIAVLLTDPRPLVNSLDRALGQLENFLTGPRSPLGRLNFPFIGKALSKFLRTEGQFIASFRAHVVKTLLRELSRKADNVALIIVDELNSFLGSLGILQTPFACHVKTRGGRVSNCTTEAASIPDLESIYWESVLGQRAVKDVDFQFDLGLPGLEFALDINAQIAIEFLLLWQIKLGFGYSITNGFFLIMPTRPDSNPLAQLEAAIRITGLNAQGRMFFLSFGARKSSEGPIQLDAQVLLKHNPESPSDSNLLSLRDLKTKGVSVFKVSLIGRADCNLDLDIGLNVNSAFVPRLFATLKASWTISKDSNSPMVIGDPQIYLERIQLDMSRLTDLINQVLGKVRDVVKPIAKVLKPLTDPLPVISDVARRPISLLDLGFLAAQFGGRVNKPPVNVKLFLQMIQFIEGLPDRDSSRFDMLPSCKRLALVKTERSWGIAVQDVPNCVHRKRRTLQCPSNSGLTKFMCEAKKFGFDFPVLDASSIMNIFTGKPVTLITFETPKARFEVYFRKIYPFPPFPPLYFIIEAGVYFEASIKIGFDTTGIMRAIREKDPLLALDGFYIATVNDDGSPYHQVKFGGFLGVGGRLNLALVRAGVNGRFGVDVGLGLVDPTGDDGRLRASEIVRVFNAKGLSGMQYLFRIDVSTLSIVYFFLSLQLFYQVHTLTKSTRNL